MKATIKVFSHQGDTTLMEYDTETVDMAEVNRLIDRYEGQGGGRAFDWKAQSQLDRSRLNEVDEIMIVNPIAGG